MVLDNRVRDLGVWRTGVWEESVGDWGPELLDALSQIEDPRKPKGVRHPLPAVYTWAGR